MIRWMAGVLRLAAPVAALALIAFLASHVAAQEGGRVIVVATSPALASVVEEIGGEHVEVRVLLPPGADPHSYEPSLQDILPLVSGASLIVMTGPHHLPVEERIERISEEGIIRARILNYEDYREWGLELLELDGAVNPHGYFFSIRGLRAIARACASELSSIQPDKSEYFEQRLGAYLEKLSQIEELIRAMDIGGVRVALGDPALQYLARDLGLEVEESLALVHGAEPSSEDVARIVRLSREGRISLVLLSDLELGGSATLAAALRENGVPYAVVPLSAFMDQPELAPISAASVLRSRLQSMEVAEPAENISNAFLIPSLAANGVLGLFLLLMLLKVRRHG